MCFKIVSGHFTHKGYSTLHSKTLIKILKVEFPNSNNPLNHQLPQIKQSIEKFKYEEKKNSKTWMIQENDIQNLFE